MKVPVFFKIISLFAFIIVLTNAKAQYNPAPFIPDFTFQTLDSHEFSKKDLVKNKKIIFILFDVTCSHCQHEMQDLGKRYKDFKNVAFYLVSMDTRPAILKFMDSYGKLLNGKPNVTVLHDYRREFVQKFMPDKYPAMYVYSEKGSLIKYLSGQKDVNEILKAVR